MNHSWTSPFASLKTWFPPRVEQPMKVPTVLILLLFVTVTYLNARTIDVSWSTIGITITNAGDEEVTIRPAQHVSPRGTIPEMRRADTKLAAGSSIVVGIDVPLNPAAWLDGVLVLSIFNVPSMGFHGGLCDMSIRGLPFSNWTLKLVEERDCLWFP